ncbi:MAG: NYN domain-containing protein [Acidobacteria bacterium]|nr:NYN domain-containing protein [Acidobacteriota bacterium]
MPYLVDGSNLGGLLGGAAGARDAAAVVRTLLPWARERCAVTLVFDGPPRADVAERYGPLAIEWSGARSADDAIAARVEREPGAWIVVTADRELARRCRDLGARVEPAPRFAEKASGPRRRRKTARAAESEAGKPPAHAEEREHWQRIFLGGDAPDDADG